MSDPREIIRATVKGRPSSSYTGSDHGEDGVTGHLADTLSQLARTLQQEQGLDATLNAIVRAAADMVPGAQEASISAVQGRLAVSTRASTSELLRRVDEAQYETGQGPCLDSLYEQQTVRLSDMRHEQRWPEFTTRARLLRVGSMLAVQLFVDGDDLGALNLLSREVDAFSNESEDIGLLFASHAAVAMATAQQREQLRHGLDTRDLIGQAKGILMERYKISGDVAFGVLVRYSQNRNHKLRLVAQELVNSGELPGSAHLPHPPAGSVA